LLYDTYDEIEELRSDSNKEYTLIPPYEIILSKNKSVIYLGTRTNECSAYRKCYSFTSDSKNMEVQTSLTFDASKLGGK